MIKKRRFDEQLSQEESALSSLLFGSSSVSFVKDRANNHDDDDDDDDAPEEVKTERNERTEKAEKQAQKTAERIVFGEGGKDEEEVLDLFVIDRSGNQREEEEEKGKRGKNKTSEKRKLENAKKNHDDMQLAPAWEDSDDDAERVNVMEGKKLLRKLRDNVDETEMDGRTLVNRLRRQREQIYGKQTAWAQVKLSKSEQRKLKNAARKERQDGDNNSNDDNDQDEDIDDDDDDDDENNVDELDDARIDAVLRRQAGGFKSRTSVLPPGRLEVSRMRDANHQDPSDCVVHAAQFHRNGQLFLTAGFDKRLRLFQIDGKTNPKLQSLYFPDLPISTAKFSMDGSQVIVSGHRKFFYTLDIVAGKVEKTPWLVGREDRFLDKFALSPDGKQIAFAGEHGNILLVSSESKMLTGTMKMNQECRNLTYSSDSRFLLSSGRDGDVYIWDIRKSNQCVNRFADEGTVHSTAIACSPDSEYIATGSDTGVVNLNTFPTKYGEKPVLKKSLMNITTPIDTLRYSSDGAILGFASSQKKASLRLYHVASGTVFSNWPTSKTPLQYVSTIDFSPNSGYLAIGNDKGRVLLYRLLHYPTA